MRLLVTLSLAAAMLLPALAADPSAVADLKRAFVAPPDDSRIMMRWWWFGPSVTRQQLEREMRLMKEGGIGGFEVQPVYPLALDDPAEGFRNYPFLSDEYLDALRFTADKAKQLGLRMDLTLGSGWPFGGPNIPISQAAGQLRIERVKGVGSPKLREGESVVAAFDAATNKQLFPPVSGNDAKEVVFFVASHTRQMVKRAAVGAEGYVLNHYDRAAIDNHLKNVGDRLMTAFKDHRPDSIFCDSLESFGSDWVPDLLEEFRKRRGYDLTPYLPALITDIGPKTKGIRHDWGRTLTELLDDRFLAPMRAWSTANMVRFRIQDYGVPPAILASNQYADTSEGEGAQWRVVRAARWASSANHIYGRNVTTSETWTWLHSPVFRATPLDVKAEADLHFVQGINQLIGHGWPYTPEGVEYPGWRFYASAVFNDKNPWWIVMPDLSRYLQRLSYMLRQGSPANDVALYLPNTDAWSHFTAGKVHMIEELRERLGTEVISRILDSGYGFDFVDDGTLSLALASKRYRIVVLPNVETMPPSTSRRLEQFAKAGGIVLATRRTPDTAPGFQATDRDHAEVRSIMQRTITGKSKTIPEETQLGAALRTALTPDLAISPASSEIGFIHRKTGVAEIYFIANNSNTTKRLTGTFREAKLTPEVWDPFTGRTQAAPVLSKTSATTTISLSIEPYGSRLIVFSAARPEAAPQRVLAGTVDLSGGWTLQFGKEPPVPVQALASWTEDERRKYYSGTATYERTIEVPGDSLGKGGEVRLHFGEGLPVPQPPRSEIRGGPGIRAWLDGPVREAAVVYVNGTRAGSVWCPSYELDITPYVKTGSNQIRVVVANLAVNHMAGHPLPDYKELHAKYGPRFDPQDMHGIRPIPSGMLGPVKLLISHGSSID